MADQHQTEIAEQPCIAPPGNLCLDTGCWDADRCIVTPPASEGNDHMEVRR